MKIYVGTTRRRTCCSPCDVVTLHFAGDFDVHVYADAITPARLAARLQRLARTLIENPTTALAPLLEAPETPALQRGL